MYAPHHRKNQIPATDNTSRAKYKLNPNAIQSEALRTSGENMTGA